MKGFDMAKKLFVKTADGSVWQVLEELPKRYLVRSKFRIYIEKRHIVAKFEKEVEKHE